MKNLLILFIAFYCKMLPAQTRVETPSAFFTDKQLVQNFTTIRQQTIWFGNEKDSIQFAIVCPKIGWAGTSYLYQRKVEDVWENIPLPLSPAHINSICGIAGEQAYKNHVIWLEILSVSGTISTYNLKLSTKTFEKLSETER